MKIEELSGIWEKVETLEEFDEIRSEIVKNEG